LLAFNKLRLSGFKSFVENTELPIELGLTGVVGPNGCGKSNLVEALRWVMGETSAKQMRGVGMEDVIFGGTSNRPPRNNAEVILTLNNQDRSAPAQFNDADELDVSRRIELDKGSNYRVNGADVRARDIQLLFADSATGARSTALVSQGRIGALINAKPKERRGILEEAAGITGLHSRRHEAELRLRGAETNLERLDDILVTLESQLAGLKKQARQASRYRNLSDHIRKAEATMFYLLWTHAEKYSFEVEKKLVDTSSQVGELTSHAVHAAKQHTECSALIPNLRQKEAEAGAKLHRLRVAQEGLEAEEQRLCNATGQTISQLQQLESDMKREREFAGDATAAIEQLTAEISDIETSRERETKARLTAEQDLSRANQIVGEIENRLMHLTEEVAGVEARRTSLGRRIEELTQQQKRLQDRAGSIADQRSSLEAESPGAEELNLAERELQDHQSRLSKYRHQLSEAESAKAEAEEKSRISVSVYHEAQASVTELQTEERVLENLLSTFEHDLFPPVIDALDVTPGFEAALGAALGDDLSSPTDEAAPLHWRTLPLFLNMPQLPQGTQSLSEYVIAPKALARRLAQVGVTETDAQARAAAPQLCQGQRLVSRQGGLWRWDGYTISSQAATPAATRLEQRNHLAELRANLADLKRAAAEAASRRDKAREIDLNARETEQSARKYVIETEQALEVVREKLTIVKERATQHSSKLSAIIEAKEHNDLDIIDGLQAIDNTKQELVGTPSPNADRLQINKHREELEQQRTNQIACRTSHEGLERRALERNQRLVAITDELILWKRRQSDSSRQFESLESRYKQLKVELERLEAAPAELNVQRTTLLEALDTSELQRTKAANNLQAGEIALLEASKKMRESETALAGARENRVRAEGAVDQSHQTCLSISERVYDKLSCKPEELLQISQVDPDKNLPSLEMTERRVERLNRERETMGPVNLRADTEAQEMQEQIDSLASEHADLVAAIDKLRQGISELNREGRARLLASFKEVDRHFQHLFVRLFGGGQAHLALTESGDPLDAGLEIMASPPGKKLQVLTLLSGGEQALTALSLLFAVFLTNPAPICVLDEVDAPLDDANVDRFCKLLDEMSNSNQTRFLVITHHRMTMARMDRLFGVTMSERGVSQLVSVDLQKATELRDIA